MTVVEGSLKRAVAQGLPDLCHHARAGSSWSALLVAIHSKPVNLAALMQVIDVPRSGKYQMPASDACFDAWSIYQDALAHGAEI